MKKFEDFCIIDDDPIAIFSLKRSAESIGISKNILVFKNGLDAFESFDLQIKNKSSLPSLIFLDLNMPVMNGWEFLEEFTKIYPKEKEMPIIFIMTSSIDVKDVEKAKAYNLEGHYLLKPVTSDVLKRVLA